MNESGQCGFKLETHFDVDVYVKVLLKSALLSVKWVGLQIVELDKTFNSYLNGGPPFSSKSPNVKLAATSKFLRLSFKVFLQWHRKLFSSQHRGSVLYHVEIIGGDFCENPSLVADSSGYKVKITIITGNPRDFLIKRGDNWPLVIKKRP
ncbi:hypothetical protein P5673_014920 [Acropora cervicornis]|uniref:Uncharacterized protein n=1 Tax=Acropora cervicornis TaxID=6130 RepID=A0AAD9QIV0_ACRCE|nr:hypothetical protein P5673_014920 [Acropora cervicornis]